MTAEHTHVPNHHAHYPGFSGAMGLLAAVSMLGRDGDARLVAELSGLHRGDTVVDIGCGPGTAARRAGRLGATVVGVDPAPVMLRVTRLLTRSTAVDFREGTAEHLPIPDGSMSVAWTIASVHHWSDLDAALAEIRRVLTAGGRFVAVEKQSLPDAHGLGSHGWTDERAAAFADSCRERGFTDVRIQRHTNGRRKTISVCATAS